MAGARTGCQSGRRHGCVPHEPARVLLAAHKRAAGEARAEQHAAAVAAGAAVGVQLGGPVRPNGEETAGGRDGRGQRQAAQRPSDD